MVQNNKWNISRKQGEDYIHHNTIEILKDSKNNTISLSKLTILLNKRTKSIKILHHKKKKDISTYIKNIYGSYLNFLDLYHIYGIMNNSDDIYVKLLCENAEENLKEYVKEYKDWIILKDEDDFIII